MEIPAIILYIYGSVVFLIISFLVNRLIRAIRDKKKRDLKKGIGTKFQINK